MLKGIDISQWQGVIDWEKVKVDFAILRIGYGKVENQKDIYFERNYEECKKYNIPVGVYHYSYAQSVEEAKQEAEVVVKWLAKRKLQLPVYFDIEDKSQSGLGKKNLTNICIAFCERIEKAGYWAGIYANKYWFSSILDGEVLGKKYTCWVAQYSTECTYKGKYDIWQYSSSGRVNGISGNVDMNYMYKDLMKEISGETKKNKETTTKKTTTKKKKIDVKYQVYAGKWYDDITNYNTKNSNGYAGVFGQAISGFRGNVVGKEAEVGSLIYKVHEKEVGWLGEIKNRQKDKSGDDFAGILGKPIDAITIKSTKGKAKYRVHIKNGNWLPWVTGFSEKNSDNGFAGILGKEIDAIQIEII